MTIQEAQKLVVGDSVTMPTVINTFVSGEVKLATKDYIFVIWEDGTRTKFPFDKPTLLADLEHYSGELA